MPDSHDQSDDAEETTDRPLPERWTEDSSNATDSSDDHTRDTDDGTTLSDLWTTTDEHAAEDDEDDGRSFLEFLAAKARLLLSPVLWALSAATSAGAWLRNLPSRAKRTLLLWLLGPEDTVGTRIGSAAVVVSLGVILAGVYLWVSRGLEHTGDSSAVMGALLGIATSLWTYAILLALLVFGLRWMGRRRKARIAAAKTGYSERTVARLAAEAETTDGTETVVVTPAESVHSTATQFLEVFGIAPAHADVADTHTIDEGTVDAAQDSADAADITDMAVHPRANLSTGDHLRMTQLELVSALETRDLAWNFGFPAAVTFGIGLLAVQIWVSIWVYLLLGAASIVVGALWYLAVHRRRRTRVYGLRVPERVESYDEIAVLVKRVETPDTTVYYGWCGGSVYADFDGIRLAWTLAEVAHAHIEPGEAVPPTIQEKFARNLKQFIPNLEGYVDAVEAPEITSVLAETVAESDGPVPKNKLLERVVEQDRQRIGGIGYDPRLVSDRYRANTPELFVEVPVNVETPTNGTQEMTAVKLRTDDARPRVIETQANYSTHFQPEYQPDFELPEVDMHTDDYDGI